MPEISQRPLVVRLRENFLMELAASGADDLDEKPGEGGLRLEGGPALAGEAARHHIHPAARRRLHGRVQEGVAPAAAVYRGSGADLQTDVLEPPKDALLWALGGGGDSIDI